MRYSALAGALAAAAGTLGKLGADGDARALQWLVSACYDRYPSDSTNDSAFAPCAMVHLLARVLCVGAMLATNALMLHYFVRGLHETDSLTATVTSAAVNFMLSAAVGLVVFQELLPTRWFIGAGLILAGVACLLHGDTPLEAPPASRGGHGDTKKNQ